MTIYPRFSTPREKAAFSQRDTDKNPTWQNPANKIPTANIPDDNIPGDKNPKLRNSDKNPHFNPEWNIKNWEKFF